MDRRGPIGVGVRVTISQRAALMNAAETAGRSLSELIRDRLRAKGAPIERKIETERTANISIRLDPAAYRWAVEGAKATGQTIAAFLGSLSTDDDPER